MHNRLRRHAVTLGAGLAFLSFFTALARSFDVITDPMMGWISDSTVSRFGMKGRRKPYMAWCVPRTRHILPAETVCRRAIHGVSPFDCVSDSGFVAAGARRSLASCSFCSSTRRPSTQTRQAKPRCAPLREPCKQCKLRRAALTERLCLRYSVASACAPRRNVRCTLLAPRSTVRTGTTPAGTPCPCSNAPHCKSSG